MTAVRLIDSLLAGAQPGASPATMGALVATLADALHADAPSHRSEAPPLPRARREKQGAAAQLTLFS